MKQIRKKNSVRYPEKLIQTARVMYVQEGKTAVQIAALLNGPSHQTVSTWAKRKLNGKPSWVEERIEFRENLYQNLSPAEQAKMLHNKINLILSKEPGEFNTKDADAIGKLNKVAQDILNPVYQLPLVFSVLEDLAKFLKLHYPDLLTEQLINAIKHFKNVKVEAAS